LVVDDDCQLLTFISRVLSRAGYNVLRAPSGQVALQNAQQHADEIHLLVTDVMMPRMDGSHLAEGLGRIHPETRVLYTSGYPAETAILSGALGADALLLEKPFTMQQLMSAVRAALDAVR
jgi:DNA-binding response OmpR family regulator